MDPNDPFQQPMPEQNVVYPGDTAKLDPNQMLTLKWFAGGGIHHLEVFPIPVGNRGGKHVFYQPEVMSGLMSFAPLTSGDIFGIFYTDETTKAPQGTAVFHVEVKGTHGFLFSLVAVSARGIRIFAGDKLKVDIGEPVNFYWKASSKATHGNLTGVGRIEPAAGTATVIVKESADYVLTLDGGDSSEQDQQTIQIECSQEVYQGYYDKNAQQLLEDNVLTAGIALGGTDQTLLEGFWLTGEDGVSKFSTQLERGKGSVTLHWKAKEAVNHVEIYNGITNLTGVSDSAEGEIEVDPPPKDDTDYVITVFAQEDFGTGYKFARGVVHVAVHGEGSDVSEHRSNLPNFKFDATKEFEIFKTPPATVLKYFKWQAEVGIRLQGSVTIENSESGPAVEIGSSNGKSIGLSIVKQWAEKHGDEHKGISVSPKQGSLEGSVVEYDKKENMLTVGSVIYETFDGALSGKLTFDAIKVKLKEVGDIRLGSVEGELSAGWGQLDFTISEHVKLEQVQLQPYTKISVWLDWRAACGEAIKDAAEDAAEDGAELAGADVALIAGAVLMVVATVAVVVMAILESADLVELGKEAVELTGDAKRGYLDGLSGSRGAGGYWYQRGHSIAEQVLEERKKTLRALPKNQNRADFDAAWDATLARYKSNFQTSAALQKVVDAAKLSLWNGYGPKYVDTKWSSGNEKMRQHGWALIYGGPPGSAGEWNVMHKFDNEHTDYDQFGDGYKSLRR